MLKGKLGILALGITTIVVLAAAGLYVRYALPEYRNANATLTDTENALATPDTLFLASIDLDFLRELEAKIYGKASLPDLQPEATPNDSVMTVLQRALMQHPDSIAYISAAAYAGKDRPMSLAVVAGGDIRTDEVINALKRSAQVTAHPQIADAWSVQKQDLDTCQMSRTITVIASQGRIIVLEGDNPELIERLQNAAPAARDLARWRDFRATRFFTAAVFIPDELSPQNLGPFAGSAAAQAKSKLTDFDAIYLGAASKAFPPGGSLSLWMAARSPEIAATKAAAWSAELASSRKDWEKTLPTIAAMHDKATIGARDNLLQTEVTLDKEVVEQMRKLPAELIGLMFSGFTMGEKKAPQTAGNAATEVLDKNPRKFTDQASIAEIPPYDPKAMFADAADVIVGPLGLQLAGVHLTDAEPRLVEIEIKAMAANLPNVSDNADSAMALSINSVRDKDGKELLRPEPCGRDRNSLAAHPSFSFNSNLSATKKVRLQESVRHADIASILGNVKLSVPTRIETVAMANPKTGDHIEREGLRIEMTQVETGSVSYRVSGKIERLLHLRARNEKGEYLATSGSMSMSSPFGKSVTLKIKGTMANLEFVLAQAVEQKDFPFELKGAHPQAKESWPLNKPPVYEAYKKAEIKRDYARKVTTPKRYAYQPVLVSSKVGPGIVDLTHVSTFRDMQLNFSLYLPPLKNLDGALSAAEVEIQKLTLTDGSIHQPVEGQAVWRAPVSTTRSGNDDYVSGRGEVDTGITDNKGELSSVSGRLWVNVPLALETSAFPLTEVDAQLTTACGPMRINEITRFGVTLEGNGDPACLFAVRALNAEGKHISLTSISLKRQAQTWRLQLSTNGSPNSLELFMVKKRERLSYPFTLTISKKETLPGEQAAR